MSYERIKVLSPRPVWWEENGVLNPGAAEFEGKVYLLYRAVGRDYLSRFGLAISNDGQNFERLDQPILESDFDNPYERLGIEDPRITKIGRDYYITYTAASVYPIHYFSSHPSLGLVSDTTNRIPWRVRVSAAKTRDFHSFQRLGVWLPEIDSKNAALFPRQIGGYFYLAHRILPNIYLTRSKNLRSWETNMQIFEPHYDWEKNKVGLACPPIETEKGWLMIYHGVDGHKTYSIGAFLTDLNNPAFVIKRTRKPLLWPQTSWEKKGKVGNVVFVTGSIWRNDQVWLYYGAADNFVGLVKIPLTDILSALND